MRPKYKAPTRWSTWVRVGEDEIDVTVEVDYDDDIVEICSVMEGEKDILEYMNDEEIADLAERMSDEAHIKSREFEEEYGDWLYECAKDARLER
jgi:hypothetical protein